MEELDWEFITIELDICLKHLKNNKLPDPEQIPSKFSFNLPSSWRYNLLSLFNCILAKKETPSEWSTAHLCMFHKAGDHADPATYRGIALVNCSTKVFSDLLRKGWNLRLKTLK